MLVMRTAQQHQPRRISDVFNLAAAAAKKTIYWGLVLIALVAVIYIGMIMINWSINFRVAG
jgi:hypothetical protein